MREWIICKSFCNFLLLFWVFWCMPCRCFWLDFLHIFHRIFSYSRVLCIFPFACCIFEVYGFLEQADLTTIILTDCQTCSKASARRLHMDGTFFMVHDEVRWLRREHQDAMNILFTLLPSVSLSVSRPWKDDKNWWNAETRISDLFQFYLSTYSYFFHAKQPGPLGDFGVWHRQVVGVDLGRDLWTMGCKHSKVWFRPAI